MGTNNVSRISLLNVKEIFEKHKDEESKGIKAHFRLDDSGLINLDKVMLIKIIYFKLNGRIILIKHFNR